MNEESDPDKLLEPLDLKEYEATALEHLLSFGRTTAPDLSEATGIPKARIYGVLDALADRGFIEIIPERPKQYQPKAPDEILDRATENRRQAYETHSQNIESVREEFVDIFAPRYEQASEDISPTEELFHVVDVGDPSEAETRALYHEAEREVNVITKSFEYLSDVETAIADAIGRGVAVNVLLLHPRHLSVDNNEVQQEILETLRSRHPEIDVRFSNEKLPWRGTIADPSMDYDSGTAILLVEENDIPLHKRQAAVTDNGSFVAGVKRYVDLIWEYDSVAAPTDDSQ